MTPERIVVKDTDSNTWTSLYSENRSDHKLKKAELNTRLHWKNTIVKQIAKLCFKVHMDSFEIVFVDKR